MASAACAAEREVLVTFISIESGTIETVLCTGYLSLKERSDKKVTRWALPGQCNQIKDIINIIGVM